MGKEHRISFFNAARVLGVSRTRVRQFVEAGKLKATRDVDGVRVWLSRAQVEALKVSRDVSDEKLLDEYERKRR